VHPKGACNAAVGKLYTEVVVDYPLGSPPDPGAGPSLYLATMGARSLADQRSPHAFHDLATAVPGFRTPLPAKHVRVWRGLFSPYIEDGVCHAHPSV
jgi:hypothetical protein